MRKAILLTAYVILIPTVLIFALSLLTYDTFQRYKLSAMSANPRVAFAALPVASGTLKTNIVAQDARVTLLKNFFKKYHSELLPYADDVVTSADKYNVDFRLVPAIAMQESGGCKNAPKDSHNCWGFGMYAKRIIKFKNYYEAIDTVTKTIAKQYVAKGLETPEQIMAKYTPSNNGAWASSVNHFMRQLDIATL